MKLTWDFTKVIGTWSVTYLDEFIDLKQNKQYIVCLTMKILCDVYIVSSFLGIVQYLDAYLKNAQKMEASFLLRCLHLHIKVDEVDDFVILLCIHDKCKANFMDCPFTKVRGKLWPLSTYLIYVQNNFCTSSTWIIRHIVKNIYHSSHI